MSPGEAGNACFFSEKRIYDMRSFARHGVMLSLSVVFALSMTGCPFSSVLNVSPIAITLSDSRSEAQIVIANDGGGTLRWTAATDAPWLEMAVDGEEERGRTISSTTRTNSILRVFLISDQLPDSTEQLQAIISISSNGGSQDVVAAIERVRTPVLAIEPAALDFEDTESQLLVEVLNRGDAVLQWQIEVPEGVDWLTVEPSSGSVLRGAAEGVTVRINRARLAPSAQPYETTLDVLSNGGDTTLGVSVLAPAFTASPAALDFGLLTQPETQLVRLETPSAEPVPLAISLNGGAEWLTLSSEAANVTSANPYDLRVRANPIGLAPGDYAASVQIVHAASSRTAVIPVVMTVGAPVNFNIDPAAIDFGETRQTVQEQVTITNEGDEPINWRIEKPASAGWIELSAEEGVLDDSATVTITANPANLSPKTYNIPLTVFAGGVSRGLRITLTRPADPIPDALQVEPTELEFGTLLSRWDINIWNEGPSQIDWSINGTSLPEWLVISPLSGTVGGAITQLVRVSIDRDLLPEDIDESLHTFEVASSAPGDTPVEVRVSVKPQRFPKIEIIGDGTDANNVPFVVIEIGEDSNIFIVRNIGKADLNWQVNMEGKPAWITAVTPQQGQLRPNREQQVRVTTNRFGLDQSGGTHRFLIRSNDPEMPFAPVDISVRVPYSIIIGVRPGTLNFGRTLSTLPFEVANFGDAGWPLDFVITSNHPEWIYVEPSRGRSIGTSSAVKDWQFISVAIDRGRIRAGATATLLIQAENVPPNALPVEPVEVAITFDIAELTIEGAVPRMRPPSLLRFNFLLRDAAQRPFPGYEDNFLDENTLYRLSTLQAQILEDSVPLELSETNLFTKKDEDLTFSVLIMLDYSASMEQAALDLINDGQLDPGGRMPLDAMYIQTVGEMLQEFPAHYKVGLAVFNERRPWWHSSIRMITGAPDPADPLAGEEFVSDKSVLQYRIENTDVLEYGATPLYPAILEAALKLYYMDWTLPDFDRLAERILVAVTDGRVTTPPGELSTVKDILEAARVRFFPIGFGNTVQANPLIQMSTVSGGHFYATDTKIIPGSFDPNGEPVTIPIFESLLDWCRTNPSAENPQSLPKDLRSHVVLSYVTLNEESSITVQARLEVEEVDPAVKETYQVGNVPAFDYSNDAKLGQIGLRTEGIQDDGAAVVRIYTDYMPRNIGALQFEITTDPALPWTATQVAGGQGGLVADWNFAQNSGIVTLTTATDRPLSYGDYGNLVDISFTGVAAPFRMNINMLDPVIDGSPDGKYFTMPRGLDVDYEPFTATSFPNPEFEFTPTFTSPRSQIIEVDPADPPATLLVKNVGGEHLPTLAALYWRVRSDAGYIAGTIPITVVFNYDGREPVNDSYYLVWPEMNNLGLAGIADRGEFAPVFPVDDLGDPIPGVYSHEFYVDVYYGSLYLNFTHGPYYLLYEVN